MTNSLQNNKDFINSSNNRVNYYCINNEENINTEDINQNDPNRTDPINGDNTFEWEYHMRREMQEILPNLWLGPYASALKAKAEVLESIGITHIICVRQDIESHWIRPNFPDKFQYLTLDIADTPTQNIIQYFVPVSQFIDQCLNKNGKVLVHGNAGISRSAALVIAYIMEKQNLSSLQAIRAVQRKRFCIFPNEGFRRQLIEYEPILQARGIPLSSDGGIKRPLSDEDSENAETNQMDFIINP